MKPPPRTGPGVPGPSATGVAIRRGTSVPVAGELQRHRLDQSGWRDLEAALRADPLPLLALWADATEIHALFVEAGSQPLVASVAVERQRYLALSQARPGVSLHERIIRDLWGFEAMSARDLRPWLDHGAWGATAPRAARPGPAAYPPEPIEFEPVPDRARLGAALRIDGPVRDGSPWMAAISADAARMLHFEPRLGFAHRGVEALLTGKPVGAAVRLASRIDGTTPVAHALALARAIEDAVGFSETQAPELTERRRILLELERIATHLHDLAAQATLLGHAALTASMQEAEEAVRLRCAEGWDHRLLFDTISPGDAAPALPGLAAIAEDWRMEWSSLARRYDAATAPALRGLAVLEAGTAVRLGVNGPVGRASGQVFDARRLGGRQQGADFSSGDALARTRLRWSEIGDALVALVPQARGQSQLPLKPAFANVGGEGLGVAESARGPVWAWVRLEAGLVAAVSFSDPSLAVWAALPGILAGIAPERLDLALASLAPGVAAADR